MIYDFEMDVQKVASRPPRKALNELVRVRRAIEKEQLYHLEVYPLVLRLTGVFWDDLDKHELAKKAYKESEIYYGIHGKPESVSLRW